MCKQVKFLVCESGWTSFLIGDEISCLKNVGHIKLKNATSICQSLNASQILPRNIQEFNDLVSALLSLDLASEDGETLVSIGAYKSKQGLWHDSVGQNVSYINWLPNKPDNLGGNKNFVGFRVDGIAGCADYSGSDELNVICTKVAGHGKNKSLWLID